MESPPNGVPEAGWRCQGLRAAPKGETRALLPPRGRGSPRPRFRSRGTALEPGRWGRERRGPGLLGGMKCLNGSGRGLGRAGAAGGTENQEERRTGPRRAARSPGPRWPRSSSRLCRARGLPRPLRWKCPGPGEWRPCSQPEGGAAAIAWGASLRVCCWPGPRSWRAGCERSRAPAGDRGEQVCRQSLRRSWCCEGGLWEQPWDGPSGKALGLSVVLFLSRSVLFVSCPCILAGAR